MFAVFTRIPLFPLLGQQRRGLALIGAKIAAYEQHAVWRGPAAVARRSVDVVSLYPLSLLRGCL